jgi:uncharacterized protein YcgL (UPF0745 family)
MKYIFLIMFFNFCFLNLDNLNAQRSISGVVFFNGVGQGNIRLKIKETQAAAISATDGYFEFKDIDEKWIESTLHIYVANTDNFFISEHKDSTMVSIQPWERKKPVNITVKSKGALFMSEIVPKDFTELYDSDYTVLLFSLENRKYNEQELENLRKKIGLSAHQLQFYRHDELNRVFYRYTLGRFKRLEDAQNLLNYLKEKRSELIDKNAQIVNILENKAPVSYYRVQVRSSKIPMQEKEKQKISRKIGREIVEVKDNTVAYPKFDYYVNVKIKEKNEAYQVRDEVVNAGGKGAYVVKLEIKENKIVKKNAQTKPKSLNPKSKRI